MASAASHSGRSATPGNNIMIAGLATQVFTLFVFMCLCIDFAIRTRRRYLALGADALAQNPLYKDLRNSFRFKGFLGALTLATICVFWRSVYRVVELGEGWTGNLIRKQNLFIAFEGVMVIVAVLALNVFHPAFCFTAGMEGAGGVGSGMKARRAERKARKAEKVAEKEGNIGGSPGSASDVEAVVAK